MDSPKSDVVFVGGKEKRLPTRRITNTDVSGHFEQFNDDIKRVWICYPRGFGLVYFKSRSAADRAIQQLDGTKLLGKYELQLNFYQKKKYRNAATPTRSSSTRTSRDPTRTEPTSTDLSTTESDLTDLLLDPEDESEAIKRLATMGEEEYHKFLKEKGALDFLSSEEKEIIRDDTFDHETICKNIESTTSLVAESAQPQQRQEFIDREGTRVLFSPPMGARKVTIRRTLVKMIRASQKEVLVAMYLFSDAYIFRALYRRAKAGVTVNIVLEESQLERFTEVLTYYESNRSEFKIKPPSMTIRIVKGFCNPKKPGSVGFAHEKFMVIDGMKAFTGSYNFTIGAAYFNRELAVFTTCTSTRGKRNSIIPELQKQFSLLENESPQLYCWPNN